VEESTRRSDNVFALISKYTHLYLNYPYSTTNQLFGQGYTNIQLNKHNP
jgi:hypothetical protein